MSLLKPSSREANKFIVRMPEGMHARVSEAARSQHRSMNAEIIVRLEQSLFEEDRLGEEVRLDDLEISVLEREMLQCFRRLSRHQRNALIALVSRSAPASDPTL